MSNPERGRGPYGGQGSKDPRRLRFRPKSRARARYYRASVVAAIVFLCLAMAFPFFLSHVRRAHEKVDLERPVFPSTPEVGQPRASAQGGGRVPNSPTLGNATCQAYGASRCNALGIEPAPCGEVLAAALQVPVEAGMEACRKVVEAKLEEVLPQIRREEEEKVAERPHLEGESTSEGQERTKENPEMVKPKVKEEREVVVAKEEGQKVDPKEREANLTRIYVLIEELQRGANNYATLPAAQQARFEELRRRIEADGSEELRSLYNTLLQRYGRTAGFETERPGTVATEAKMEEALPGEEAARPTTPELDKVRKLIEKAGGQAPPLAPATPVSVEPSAVEAPPARSP